MNVQLSIDIPTLRKLQQIFTDVAGSDKDDGVIDLHVFFLPHREVAAARLLVIIGRGTACDIGINTSNGPQ
jgi:hypothetical protein